MEILKKDPKNIIVFGADLSDSKHEDNKNQSILVLGYGSVKKIQKSMPNNHIYLISLLIIKRHV